MAKNAAEKLGLAVSFQMMDVKALSFEDDSLDTVVLTLSTGTSRTALQEMS